MIFNKGKGTKDLGLMKDIATNIVADKAAKDKLKENVRNHQSKNSSGGAQCQYSNKDELSDEDISSGEEELMGSMREKIAEQIALKQRELANKEITGVYLEKSEKEFFSLIENKRERIVCHFYHPDFERCRILDNHLARIAYKHLETLFIKINATTCPFLVQKLKLKVLPVIYYFENGVAKDTLVGFEELGGEDGFGEHELSRRLSYTGALQLTEDEHFKLNKKKKRIVAGESDSEDDN